MSKKTIPKYLCLMLLQFLLYADCLGQDEKVDRIKKLLPALKNTSLVDSLNELCSSYIEINTDSALLFASRAILESEKINYVKGKALAYYNLGLNERIVGTYPAMEEYFTKAVVLFEGIKSEKNELQLAKSYELLGLSRWAQGKFDQALASYKNAERLALKIGNDTLLGLLYGAMGALETQRGQYKSSQEYC